MHEITLCQRALAMIEDEALRHHARRVTAVWLEIGAFSCAESSAMDFCFELVCRDTIAEGCQLHVSQQEAKCWCPDCQESVTLISNKVRRCPQCQSDRLQISGDESLQIKRLEIEQETHHV